MDIEQARANMVQQQIRPYEVLDTKLLDLLATLPREVFVPKQFQQIAFADTEIPLAENQFMLAPKIIGKILQAIHVTKRELVLEIGTGSGYLTALLALLSQKVTSIEIHKILYEQARKRLQTLNIQNVAMLHSDAMQELHLAKSCDLIVLTGSVAYLPNELSQAMRYGSRIFAVIGQPPIMHACLLTRIDQNNWSTVQLFETCIPQLINVPYQPQFEF